MDSHGDIDTTPVPRIYIVWEGTIARRPEPKPLVKRVLSRREPMVVDEEVRAHLWDIWQRIGIRFDAVTFNHDADEVQSAIDAENLPIASTWHFATRGIFIAALPHMPWVYSVIDHEHPMSYGGRGGSLDSVRR